MADEVLQQGVRGITDLMVMPGLINLDFADVRSVMSEMGKAMMGTGEASGDNRAIEAAEKAIANPLLDGVSMKGATGVIVSIVGGEDMRLMEVDEAASHIKELVDPDANIIWGSAFNNDLEGRIRVSVVATGIEAEEATKPEPARVFAFPGFKAKTVEPLAAVGATAVTVAEEAPLVLTPPEGQAEPIVAETSADDSADDLILDTPLAPGAAAFDESDELLLEAEAAPVAAVSFDDTNPAAGSRWLAAEPARAIDEVKPAVPGGGTLFERMSNMARGAAKVEPDSDAKDPLDIPRFLNRQNNQ